jgi:medium-chain acyl-[acyl-carrier-protein] hydrolase
VQLPGREKRLREPPVKRLGPLVDEIAHALGNELDLPFAIFGHSMGALLGFELARRFRRDLGRQPVHLFVSGHRAPQLPDPDPPIHDLPDDEFVTQMQRLNGTPQAVFESPELMELVLPTLRADFTLCETFAYRPERPLTCPVSVYGALQDKIAQRPDLEAWCEQTSGPFVVRMFPGDHFFIHTSQPLLLETLNRELQALLGALPP